MNSIEEKLKQQELIRLYDIFRLYRQGQKEVINDLFTGCQPDTFLVYKAHPDDEDPLQIDVVDDTESDLYKLFSIELLNLMLKKAISTYMFPGTNTSKYGYAKFHRGVFDVDEIPSVMTEIIFCLLEGTLPPPVEITDGVSFLKAVKHHLTIAVNGSNAGHSKDVSYDACTGEDEQEQPILEAWSHDQWREESCCQGRLYPYGVMLRWLQRNEVDNLFKANATEIQLLVKAIKEEPATFTNLVLLENETYRVDGYEMVKHEAVAQLIRDRYGIPYKREAVTRNLRLLEKRMLRFLFLDLEYGIGEDGRLHKIPQSQYKRLYTLEQAELYRLCQSYKAAPAKERDRIEDQIRSHDVFLQSVPGVDMDEEIDQIISLLLAYIDRVDKLAVETVTAQVPVKEKYRGWEWSATTDEDAVQLKLWSCRTIKKPKSVDLPKKDLTVYEALDDYILADSRTATGFWLDKKKRVIVNTNPAHENIFIPVR